MESKNPVFNAKTLEKFKSAEAADAQLMTVHGTINSVGILLCLTVASSIFSWVIAETALGSALAIGSIFANLVLCIVIVRKKEKSPVLAPAYAVIEGLVLGFITYWSEKATHGIAVNALISTFSVVALMLFLYQNRILQATETFKRVVVVATLAIAMTYIIDLILHFCGSSIPFVHQGSTYGIIFSVAVVGIAALNLILDFDMIEKAVEQRAPKWMEWYGGFAVLITIIWLYVEILRLLGKARD